MNFAIVEIIHIKLGFHALVVDNRYWKMTYLNPLKPDVWERLVLPRGGAQRHPLEINEGVSGEQDSLNTIFNTHKIRIVCKI